MEGKQFFTTQFGEKIELIPGYGDSTGFNKKKALAGKKLNEVYERLHYVEGSSINIEVDNFGRDVITYALLMDFLEDNGLLPKEGYNRSIDIGGREGIHAALFRAQHSKYAVSADLMDGNDPDFAEKMKKIIQNQKKHKWGEMLLEDNPITAPILGKLFPGKKSRRHMTMCGVEPSKKNFYNFNFKREADVDKFMVGDFLNTSVDGKFDMATCFLALCLIDYKKLVEKVSSMLEPGGVFAFFERYTWGPGPVTGLSGDFPYFEKRMTLEDIKKYYQEFKPDELEYVEKLYNHHDPTRTSIKQYVDHSYDAGLNLIAFKPLVVPFLSDTIDETYKPGDPINRDINAKEVLRDINHFRADIDLRDLFTSYFMMAFKKV
ncbi:MAG: hypothetical protein A2725_01105 [Candidatus Magasanikbacteria bacterium RIFCSPHIGHO2_01_FULL_33_34]|uniref:Methyltransferase type 11 domain-containing protein n=1 Tax=Candidatus Magasanikbacteria bacterium RIFCSPHIGHO2_01_FULL_33_34 TaxID=1798671 RepID=A0A1F6LJ97_9BACT|nr:MAG: hypothetical protein A2725_01105 [Candidatus Magasanikbacteria bacterium RIFCSPHIGHO2_01_FULL_33_34]OGH65353.1 MAG: hypothetical protein A3B83_04765 [Candidatus Magasanikbacteria bacterium RIFCSPHIGHO2_02_FULL_33_17]OGH76129.1 MAG: hypothetical protein A3A89_01685 [Candidatus Magasanikbacteria bacterium RIFCSPLOWO2_01_FULL_33_34]OGH81071.1 MAG: hypothetical protein A3F93_02815 [Candidatus Magasanikbacteria bacterium RIFCSPLOWO2_12_FULL_34_7]